MMIGGGGGLAQHQQPQTQIIQAQHQQQQNTSISSGTISSSNKSAMLVVAVGPEQLEQRAAPAASGAAPSSPPLAATPAPADIARQHQHQVAEGSNSNGASNTEVSDDAGTQQAASGVRGKPRSSPGASSGGCCGETGLARPWESAAHPAPRQQAHLAHHQLAHPPPAPLVDGEFLLLTFYS
ncbi:hypothetical protein QAD02_014562 [Eretmocerus hayati]|uniref:Uncharacterized protein n=1 Tax=Eretmocerus hayati TaxID=131215 RepID=A0ACC2P5C7_9HYME|nr:hypothetical protein QAD02_014562 [Eretmocerus hayati]